MLGRALHLVDEDSTMYKPYISRQKSGKSVQTTASAGDKTTLKLVTHQLRASQKVLNKSDQFIPSSLAVTRVYSAQPALPGPARPMRGQDNSQPTGRDWWPGKARCPCGPAVCQNQGVEESLA